MRSNVSGHVVRAWLRNCERCCSARLRRGAHGGRRHEEGIPRGTATNEARERELRFANSATGVPRFHPTRCGNEERHSAQHGPGVLCHSRGAVKEGAATNAERRRGVRKDAAFEGD